MIFNDKLMLIYVKRRMQNNASNANVKETFIIQNLGRSVEDLGFFKRMTQPF